MLDIQFWFLIKSANAGETMLVDKSEAMELQATVTDLEFRKTFTCIGIQNPSDDRHIPIHEDTLTMGYVKGKS